ncbi:MAG: hypothetical protein Kow0069_21700 [Promethearchaeota archaeon]
MNAIVFPKRKLLGILTLGLVFAQALAWNFTPMFQNINDASGGAGDFFESNANTEGNPAPDPATGDYLDLVGLYGPQALLFALYNLHLFDNSTDYGLNGTVRHAANYNWSTIVDDDRYALDQALYYGVIYERYLQALMPGLFDNLKNSTLWNSEVGAFRERVDNTSAVVTETLPIDANAMTLQVLDPYVTGTFSVAQAENWMVEVWDAINGTMWDEAHSMFLATNSTDPANAPKDVAGVLWGIIAACLMHQNDLFRDDSAWEKAQRSWWALNDSSPAKGGWDEVRGGFFKSMAADGTTTATDKVLKTNALGIVALTKMAISSGLNQSYLDYAEKAYQFVRQYMYNDTWNAYLDHVEENGLVAWNEDPKFSLASSAYLLMAQNQLYRLTGNGSYYEDALDLVDSINFRLFDQVNAGYNTSLSVVANDTNKDAQAMGLFVKALKDLSQTGRYALLNASTNQTTYVKEDQPVVHVALNYNISHVYNYSYLDPTSAWAVNSTIQGASTKYIVRYPNGTVMHILTGTTDVNGSDSVEFSFPATAPVGDYTISIYVNRTGFLAQGTTLQVTLSGGISFLNVTTSEYWVQGVNSTVEVKLESIRIKPFFVQLNATGLGVQTFSQEFEVENATTTELSFSVAVLPDAELGTTRLYVALYNQSVRYADYELYVEVKSCIEVEGVQSPSHLVPGEERNVSVFLRNLRTIANEPVKVTVVGDNFETTSTQVTVLAGELRAVVVPLRAAGALPTGEYQYTVNVTRNGVGVYSKVLYLATKLPVEVRKLTTPAAVLQGQPLHVFVHLVNNMESLQEVVVRVNGKTYEGSYKLLSGENRVEVVATPLGSSPYQFGDRRVVTEVYYGGNLLLRHVSTVRLRPSVSNVVWGFVFPLLLPFVIFVTYKQVEMSSRIFQIRKEK